jgi:hypothetical protein
VSDEILWQEKPALSLLERMRIVSRSDVHEAVRAFMHANRQFRGAYVCPFGGPKDSSAIVTYYVQDLRTTFNFDVVPLLQAASDPTRPILFVDDLIGSGGQARTIILTWLGLAKEAPLDEDHGEPLPEALLDGFKRRELGFLFVAGRASSAEQLQCELTEMELKSTVRVHMSSPGQLPRAFNGEASSKFRRRCEGIGRQLLRTGTGKTRTPAWVRARALGYGNEAYLLAFPYNTPTQALTLLWCGGTVDGWSWLPLLPRRTKL